MPAWQPKQADYRCEAVSAASTNYGSSSPRDCIRSYTLEHYVPFANEMLEQPFFTNQTFLPRSTAMTFDIPCGLQCAQSIANPGASSPAGHAQQHSTVAGKVHASQQNSDHLSLGAMPNNKLYEMQESWEVSVGPLNGGLMQRAGHTCPSMYGMQHACLLGLGSLQHVLVRLRVGWHVCGGNWRAQLTQDGRDRTCWFARVHRANQCGPAAVPAVRSWALQLVVMVGRACPGPPSRVSSGCQGAFATSPASNAQAVFCWP